MAGHSRSKNGVASLAYVPAISLREALCSPKRDAGTRPGMTIERLRLFRTSRAYSAAAVRIR
jgi:hypothetical protein